MPTSEIRAEWAAQRIKGLSFFSAAKSAFFGNKGNKIKSLISEFNYPRYGPGQMWETMTDDIRELGGQVLLDAQGHQARLRGREVRASVIAGEQDFEPAAVISSLPLRNMVGMAESAARGPRCSPRPRACATATSSRSRVVLDGEDLFPDNWIYIHEPERERRSHPELPLVEPVDGARPDQGLRRPRVLLLRGRRAVGDGRRRSSCSWACTSSRSSAWRAPTSSSSDSSSACRRRTRSTTSEYAERVSTIRSWLDGLDNFIQVGRNGLHRYNNSDHSMLTAMRAVDNLVKGTDHDIWAVNAESVYHEEEKQDEQQPYIEAPDTDAMKEPLHS